MQLRWFKMPEAFDAPSSPGYEAQDAAAREFAPGNSKGASEPTPAMRERFTQLLRDAHAFVNPETANRSVVDFGRRNTPYEFALYDSEGAKLDLECAIDTLFLLESFFNKDVGTFDSHEKLCYWLRDIFEPNGPGEAPPAPAPAPA